MKLIVQHEAPEPIDCSGQPIFTGVEMFQEGVGDSVIYSYRCHARTYNGVQVKDSYTTPIIRMRATKRGDCTAELYEAYRSFRSLYIRNVVAI